MPRFVTAAAAAAIIVAACQSVASSVATPMPERPKATPNPPIIVEGWAFRVPFPLPEGAVALELPVEQIPDHFSIPAGAGLGCPQALIRFTLVFDADAPPAEQINRGEGPVWPYGYSARFYEGRAEVVSPAGYVTMRDGETKSFGGGGDNDGRFHICMQSLLPKPVETATPS